MSDTDTPEQPLRCITYNGSDIDLKETFPTPAGGLHRECVDVACRLQPSVENDTQRGVLRLADRVTGDINLEAQIDGLIRITQRVW